MWVRIPPRAPLWHGTRESPWEVSGDTRDRHHLELIDVVQVHPQQQGVVVVETPTKASRRTPISGRIGMRAVSAAPPGPGSPAMSASIIARHDSSGGSAAGRMWTPVSARQDRHSWPPSVESQCDGEIAPLIRIGTIAQELGDAGDDGAELVVAERPDEDAAGVMPARLGPFP